ncbi:hypothetical protein LOD99_4236 [Oopsacas minuta]|uniref:Uncharacterized protein n=1 Tax=Oopsacas minuta TaxID=111878 RepID=A0AAV7JWN0_9METZ|nr:hypothetical protein LOD99_4236 [Oopsacas minuta]
MRSFTHTDCRILTKVTVRTYYFVRGKYVHEPKPIEPHPLGPPKNWRTCFVVDAIPRKTAPISPALTFTWLTKTRELLDEDGNVGWKISQEKEKRDRELTIELMDRVQQVIDSHAHLVKLHSQRSDAHFMGLLTNLLVYMASCKEYSHLHDCSAARDLEYELYWKRNGVKFVSKSSIDYVLRTKHPLPLIQDPSPETDESILQENYRPTDMVFFDKGFSVLGNYGGFRVDIDQTRPHVHTMFCYRTTASTESALKMYGLTILFSQALAQARQSGLRGDAPLLPRPVVSQGVFLNFSHAIFLRFQLNTLDYSSDSAYYNWLQSSPLIPRFNRESSTSTKEINFEYIQHLISSLSSPTDNTVLDVHELNQSISLPKPELFIPRYPRLKKYKNNVYTYRKNHGLRLQGKLTGRLDLKCLPEDRPK